MGNTNTEPQPIPEVTPQTLAQSVITLKSQLPSADLKNPLASLYKAIATINQQFLNHGIYQIKHDNLTYINPTYLTLFLDPNFQTISTNWFKHYQQLLEQLTKSTTLLIKLPSWRMLTELTKLLICFSSDRMFYVLNNVSVLPLDPESKEVVGKYSNSSNSFEQEQKGTFITKLNRNQAEGIYKYLLIVMNMLSGIKTGHISRSDSILEEITKFSEYSFVIFNRIYFSDNNYVQLRKRAIKVNNETNIEQVAYFLGYSVETKNSSLFDISVVFAISLISGGKTNPNITNLPSHLFKHLPTSSTNNIYNFILEIVLLSLTQKKTEQSCRISCNKFNALRLCYYLLLYSFASLNDIIIDYIQNISAFVKLDEVERVFVVYFIEEILKIKETEHLRKHYSKLGKPFELVLANTKLKYECDQIVDYFKKHEEFLLEEMQSYYYDYMQEVILKKSRQKVQSKVFWERIINSKRENRVTC